MERKSALVFFGARISGRLVRHLSREKLKIFELILQDRKLKSDWKKKHKAQILGLHKAPFLIQIDFLI